MKTALIHDWLVSSTGGSENTLKQIHALFPAPIYTLLHNPSAFPIDSPVYTSFIQKLPRSFSRFRSYLPLFPLAIEQFDLSSYDLVLSSSHCVAKGVITHSEQTHICYCHTPMRYAWDPSHLKDAGLTKGLKSILAKLSLHYLRSWDTYSASRVDHFIANSHFVARRIQKTYNRPAKVIYPPVDTSFFSCHEQKENYYLTSSRLVPYKKIDLIVDAFAQMPHTKLLVIGDGPEANKIKQKAKANIEFLGYQPNDVLRHHLQHAKAFVFAALEDFGILPIEAMACGTPVIALNKGGTAETVLDHKTGVHFHNQTIEDIQQSVKTFETLTLNPQQIAAHAASFNINRFRQEFSEFVSACIKR